MPEKSNPTGAVFLSYASQDAEAAGRICDALRAAGVEVWLDKSELRGGDAWDAQIKKHIHDCALFIPVVSAHSNARSEGYFRREWKQATRRLQDLADDVAFLVPVVIDETREADARVPEEFLRAQWTWLPGGETPPAFAQRVRQLLGADGVTIDTAKSAAIGKIQPSVRIGYARNRRSPLVRLVVPALIALLVLGGGALWYYQDARDAPALKPAAAKELPVIVAALHEKSIAVLPFVNMSSDPEQEYFSDGMSEQVLNLLSKVPELRVIARTSSFAFREMDMDVATIGQRLNVAHVLEGSVRKSGNRVRVTTQLINVADSSQRWSETYDRELTDIFAVQDEIALAVVDQLKLALLNGGLPARSATTSLEAYNFYLRGRYFSNQSSDKSVTKAAEFYAKALEADHKFAEAWAELAYVQVYTAGSGLGIEAPAVGFGKARASAQEALRLKPNLARAHTVLGSVYLLADWDWNKAYESFTKAVSLDPSSADALSNVCPMKVLFGAPDAGIALCNKAVALDPISADPRYALALNLFVVGRLDEAETEMRALLELFPEVTGGWSLLGMIQLQKGQAAPALDLMRKEPNEAYRLFGLAIANHAAGRREASDMSLTEFIEKYADIGAYQVFSVYAYRGEIEKAFDWLDRAYRQRDSGMVYLSSDPLLAKIKGDARYGAMIRKLGLPNPA